MDRQRMLTNFHPRMAWIYWITRYRMPPARGRRKET